MDRHRFIRSSLKQLTIITLLFSFASQNPHLRHEAILNAARNSFDGVNQWLTTGMSKQCSDRVQNLSVGERWKYVDASGRPRSGILGGNIQWFGSFDQCLKIPEARYCLVTAQGNFTGNTSLSIFYGVCVPGECNRTDVTIGVEYLFANVTHRYFPTLHVHGGVSGSGVNCYEEPSYTAGVILTILFSGLIVLLCVIGTVIEMAQESLENRNKPALVKSSHDSVKSTDEHNADVKDNEIIKVHQQDETTPLLLAAKQQNKLNGIISVILGHGELTESVEMSKGSEQMPVLKPAEEKTRDSDKEQSQNIVIDFFLCFSVLRNTRKVFNTDVTPSTITSLNGIRVISLFWVILGHTFLIAPRSGVVENMSDIIHDSHKLSMMVITNAFFAVDSFLFLSGLLLAFYAFKHLKSNNGRMNWSWFYFHRYLRLTPTLMFVILFVVQILPLLDKSPMWYTRINDQRCADYWWTNLLYINNFHPSNVFQDLCLGVSWYLAIDMQFFIITSIIVWFISRFRNKGLVGTSTFLVGTSMFLLIGSTISIAIITDHYDIDPMVLSFPFGKIAQVKSFFNKLYTKPYCRIQPYIIGFVFGYLMHTKLFITKRTGWALALLCWCLAIIVGVCLVYAPNNAVKEDPRSWTKSEKILYATVRHLLWGLSLAWVTYACEYGYGGYVKEFLSAKFWIPLSRLNYSAFLVHLDLLTVIFVGYRTGLHYTTQLMAYFFCASLVLSYALAFVLVLTIEFPCANLEKMVMKRRKKHASS